MSVIQSLQTLTQQWTNANLIDSTYMGIVRTMSNRNLLSDELLSNKAIICSIHQPPSNVFECFSHVIIMNSGHIVFQGSVEETADHFTRYFKYAAFKCIY